MNLRDLFKSKPAWQSSKPQKRKEAIAALEDQVIIRHLAEHDPDDNVRAAAIRKIEPQQALYDFIIAMGKSKAFADLNIRRFAISCMKDKSLLFKLLDEDTTLNRNDLQEINYILRDSDSVKRLLKNATLTEYITALKEGVLTGKDLDDAENSALAQFADWANKCIVTSMNAIHLAEVLSAPSLLRVLREKKQELAMLREPAWIALFNKTINNADSTAISQTAEYHFIQEEWAKIKQQADSLHFSEEQYERIRNDVKMLGRHPVNSIQWLYLQQVVANTPKTIMTGYDLGDSIVTLTIRGAVKLPALPRDKEIVYQLAGLKTEKIFPSGFENIRFFTGFPLVCAKCGKPMKKMVVMAGHSCLHRSFARIRMVADNAQEIFDNMNHLRELISVPSCGVCDVSQGISFKDRDLNPGNVDKLTNESNFYTDDEQMAANLHRNGFLVEKFRFENKKATKLPLNFAEPRCLFCDNPLGNVDVETPLIKNGIPLDICMNCRDLYRDTIIYCQYGHVVKVTTNENENVFHECVICHKSMFYTSDGDRFGDKNFSYSPCKGKKHE